VNRCATQNQVQRSLFPQAVQPNLEQSVIAAVNRCATQNQVQRSLFPQAVKPNLEQCVIAALKGLRHTTQNQVQHRVFSVPIELWGGAAVYRCDLGDQF
jgi:hypothetical protein